jgi:hypothetical protein
MDKDFTILLIMIGLVAVVWTHETTYMYTLEQAKAKIKVYQLEVKD